MTRPYVRVIVFLFVGCTIGLLLIATKIAESIPGKVVRATYRKSGKHGHPEIAQFYEDLNSAASSIQPIPKILHHVYLDGLANLQQAESGEVAKPGQRFPGYNSTWRHSCHIVHPNWQYMFWNNSQAENLIRTAYPWFLATFQSYNNYVQKGDAMQSTKCPELSCGHECQRTGLKLTHQHCQSWHQLDSFWHTAGDALRPFLMHAIGGMYLDIDVECFSPTDALLSGREVVLQLEDSNPKSLNNAVMASIPGHPFWIKVIQLMLDRGSTANERNLFGLRDLGTVLKTTGRSLPKLPRSCIFTGISNSPANGCTFG